MSQVPTITLNNGVEMPQLGFGVWQVPDDEADSGRGHGPGGRVPQHRHRRDLRQRGRAPARPSPPPACPREELFVTTKLWNTEQGYDSTLRAFDASLDKLGLDYVDLYLIHWPVPAKDAYVDTYKAFEKILADGRAKAIGVSNFHPGAPGAAARRDVRRPGGQPDRAAPAAPAGRVARLPRRARHRHRGLVAAGPGQGPPGGPDGRRRRRRSTAGPPPRWCCAGTSSSATW